MNTTSTAIDHAAQEGWLKRYYFTRAAFSIAWVLAALGPGRQSTGMAAVLLVVYPVWDALANLVDGTRSGGLARNRSQAINVVVSLAVAGAVAIGLPDMHRAMVLSGAQSALAGAFFIYQAGAPAMPSIATVIGYAGFGAFYFLVSALWLSVASWRAGNA
jgi:hypothetical protein